jgi:PAS domain S-box-containing protein
METLRRLWTISSADPDEQRRSWLLNIMLAAIAAFALLAILATAVVSLTGEVGEPGPHILYLGSAAALLGIAVIFAINRFWSGSLASAIFLLFLVGLFAFADEPQEVVDGRSLFLFAIPILMASVLLRPYASFFLAALSGLVIVIITLTTQEFAPNVPAILGFFAIAVVSWLAARSLERALAELRAINRELDQRVEQRTRDLAAALAREQAEASKNQAILEGIADGVIVFDNDGKAIVANPAIARLVEQAPHRIIGQDIGALMGEQVDATSREMIANLLDEGGSQAPSIRFDWGRKTLSVSVAPVRATPDRVTGTVAVFRDYTREAEVERMKSAFVSMVSHDLRTPLSAIIGYADMLRESVYGPLSRKQLDAMERIAANAQRQLSMINNILDQTRIEAGKLTLHIAPFDPRKLLADTESVMGVLTRSKGLEIRYQIDADVPAQLPGDQQRLHQIIVNLVNNAIKFTEQGSVTVRIYRPDPQHWALDVTDTGPGIPPEAQSYIFEPFRQVDGSITREHTGVGLGLSIVKQLTTLMGGQVELTSQVGHGSTFTIVLPFTFGEEAVS